jgi:hypothetical protein
MATLPKSLKYRGAIYQQVRAADEEVDDGGLVDQVEDEVDKAVAALGGRRTGQKIGGPDKLRDGGEPWSTEVVVKVSKLQPETDLATAFPFSTIEWCGWVEARLVEGKLQLSATGTLALDGLCFDDQARILSRDDVVVGEWDGSGWTWRRDVRS